MSRYSHSESRLEKTVFYSLLIMLLWIPLPLGSNRPWAWGVMELGIFVLTIGALISYVKNERYSLYQYKVPIIIWLLFLTFCFIQTIPLPAELVKLLTPKSYALQLSSQVDYYRLSIDPGQSNIMLLKSIAYFMLFLTALISISNEKKLKLVLTIMLISGALQALYGALEVLVGAKHSLVFDLPVSQAATGSFVYKNHYANFLMLCLCAGIGLIVASLQNTSPSNSRDWLRSLVSTLLGSKALIRISLAIMVIALVMSKSRMGNTAFFASMTIVGVLALFLIKNRTRGLTWLIVSMFIVDLFIVSAWFGLEKVQQRLTETSLATESRDEVIKDALPIANDFFATGSGAGSFYSIFPTYKRSQVDSFYDHAHNDFLQSAIEYGIVGFLLLALLVVLSLAQALKAMRQRKNNLYRGAAFACVMAIIGMLIHMTVDFPLQAPTNAAYWVVFLAICWKVMTLKTKVRKKQTAF